MFKAKAYDVIGAKPRHLENRPAVPQALVAAGFAGRRPGTLPRFADRPCLQLDVVHPLSALDRNPLGCRRIGDTRSVQSAVGAVSGAAGLASGERGRGARDVPATRCRFLRSPIDRPARLVIRATKSRSDALRNRSLSSGSPEVHAE
jgi:hypothetical protein